VELIAFCCFFVTEDREKNREKSVSAILCYTMFVFHVCAHACTCIRFRLVLRALNSCSYKSTRDILKIGTSFQNLDISANNLTYALCINIIILFSAIKNKT